MDSEQPNNPSFCTGGGPLDGEAVGLREALAGASLGVWAWDVDANRLTACDHCADLLGYTQPDAPTTAPGHAPVTDEAHAWGSLIAPDHREQFYSAFDAVRNGEADSIDIKFRATDAASGSRWILCRGAVVNESDGPRRIAGKLVDITDLMTSHEHLRLAAHHDRLTGLPNRHVFTDRLEMAMERTAHDPTSRFAGLFGDFDRFKVINDTMGHRAGDELLVSIATRFRHVLRDRDIVARLGGDEFVVLLDDVRSIEEAAQTAARARAMLVLPTPPFWPAIAIIMGTTVATGTTVTQVSGVT